MNTENETFKLKAVSAFDCFDHLRAAEQPENKNFDMLSHDKVGIRNVSLIKHLADARQSNISINFEPCFWPP